jgi:hypothetical protein
MDFTASLLSSSVGQTGQDVVGSGLPSDRKLPWRTIQIIRYQSLKRRSMFELRVVEPAFCGKRFVELDLIRRILITGCGQE